MEPETESPGLPPTAPDAPAPATDRYAHLRKPENRGRGVRFARGDKRNRGLSKRYLVPRDKKGMATIMQNLTANVLLEPSPNGKGEARIVRILCALSDKAERGDVDASELLLDRFAGKVKATEEGPKEGGRIVIEWDGPPPPWAPRPVLEAHAAGQPTGDEPQKGSVVSSAPCTPQTCSSTDAIDAEIVSESNAQG